MSRSLKKGPFIADHLLTKIEKMNQDVISPAQEVAVKSFIKHWRSIEEKIDRNLHARQTKIQKREKQQMNIEI